MVENVCFFNSVMQMLCSLPLFRDYINQLQPAEGVAKQIKNIFREIDERRNKLLMPPSSLLNDTAGILSSDSTLGIMIRQSVIKKLEKQQDITINHVKSSVLIKSTLLSRTFKENGKNRKKFMRHNLDDDKRKQLKENDEIRKKQMGDNLDDKKKGELKKIDNKRKRKNVTTLILVKRNC